MSKVSFITQLKELKKVLPGMSPTERVQHLWTYYKWLIPVVLAIIVLISIVLSSVTNLSKTTVMGGVAVNVPISDVGEQYLNEDYREFVGLTSERQSVVFVETYIHTAENATDFQDNYYSLMSLLALCSNQQVDYLLMNEEAISVLIAQEAFKDLREIYTQEELDAFGERVIWMENVETKEAAPVALDVTDIPFIQENTNVKGKVFFAYVANSPRTDAAKDLFDYLQAWKTAEN